MAGQILLVSCLLAICLPIIFVQLPRFATVENPCAEIEAEERSAVLRPPISPPRMWEILRRITRHWSEASLNDASAQSEQKQSSSKQAAQTPDRRRWYPNLPRPVFQGDACADVGRTSNEEEELRKARAGKKPWDTAFWRQLPRTGLVKKNPGWRRHADNDASPPRKSGQDFEARGLARRLFPPDPVPELGDGNQYNLDLTTSSGKVQAPQEPPFHRLPLKNQPQAHDNGAGPSSEKQQSTALPPQRSNSGSLPSSLDGSPFSSMHHLPRGTATTKSSEDPRCFCIHCRHTYSESSVPRSPSIESVAPNESSLLVRSTRCRPSPHTCHCHRLKNSSSRDKETPTACAYPTAYSRPKNDLRRSAQNDADKESSRTTAHDNPIDSSREDETAKMDIPKANGKRTSKAASKESRADTPCWQVLLVIMGFLLFVSILAVLIAHCLAWFLVYKTEARLGEVRAGLLRGGEMKLCLRGKG